MIIFGTKAKTKTVGKGQFFCPHCQTTRQYERKHAKNYFSLYFIPIFPIGDGGEFVECQTCHRAFNPQVVNQKPASRQPDVVRLLNGVKIQLERGQSVEYVIRDLTAEGIDREIATNIVNMAIGTERKVCPQCDLTYAPDIATCPECNAPLEGRTAEDAEMQ